MRNHLWVGAAGMAALSMLLPAGAAAGAAAPQPRFAVSALTLVGHQRTYDVANAPAVARARVQVKDHDKKLDPTSVVLTVAELVTGAPVSTTTVDATRVGKSKVVSNWRAVITVPQGSVEPGTTATYCLRVVTAAAEGRTAPVTASARGLAGRDCFQVTNTAPVA